MVRLASVEISFHCFTLTSKNYFNNLSGKYDKKPDVQSLYEVVDGKGKAPFFRGVDRIKLMKSIFENNVSEGGAGLNLEKMLESGKPHLLAIFPLHDYHELAALQNEWLILYDWPSQQPFTKIR